MSNSRSISESSVIDSPKSAHRTSSTRSKRAYSTPSALPNEDDDRNLTSPDSTAHVLVTRPVGVSLPSLESAKGPGGAKFDCNLFKRRKWPLKGWHKRYFCMDHGILSYAKNKRMYDRGKIKGSINIPEAAISVNMGNSLIDIDAGEVIYHLRARNRMEFYDFVDRLKYHRHMASMRTTYASDALASHSQERMNKELLTLRTNIDTLGTMLQELKSSLGADGSPTQRRDMNKSGTFEDSDRSLSPQDSKVKKFMGLVGRRHSPSTKHAKVEFDDSRFPSQAQNFMGIAKDVANNIESLMSLLSLERLHASSYFETIDPRASTSTDAHIHQLVKENAELKHRLHLIASAASLEEQQRTSFRGHRATDSVYSDVSTVTQWFDAMDVHVSDGGDTTEDDADSIMSGGDDELMQSEDEANYVDIEQTDFPRSSGLHQRTSPPIVIHGSSKRASEVSTKNKTIIENISSEFFVESASCTN